MLSAAFYYPRIDDLTFEPHVAIGFFGAADYEPLDPNPTTLDEGSYAAARQKAEDMRISKWGRLDYLTIVQMDENLKV